MTTEEKYNKLKKIVPEYCNIVTGFLTAELDVTTVGVNTPDGIVALPPFLNVPNVIEHYWQVAESGQMIVINAGKEDQRAYRWDGVGFIKQGGGSAVIVEREVVVEDDGNEPPSSFQIV